MPLLQPWPRLRYSCHPAIITHFTRPTNPAACPRTHRCLHVSYAAAARPCMPVTSPTRRSSQNTGTGSCGCWFIISISAFSCRSSNIATATSCGADGPLVLLVLLPMPEALSALLLGAAPAAEATCTRQGTGAGCSGEEAACVHGALG